MTHPYTNIPERQRWSRAMAGRELAAIDPVSLPPWRIDGNAKIVTAGSCFAQHLARHLRGQGFALFDTEPPHPLMSVSLAESYGYGIYAARYGNIYTSRQLLQLWRRANGQMLPVDDIWQDDDCCFDPFRPTIQPGGFSSLREYNEDRRQHFAAVRRAFSEMDVFVFTLGLTECWVSREDGAAYPLCPGVAAGRFDAARHVMVNLTVSDVVEDLRAFATEVRRVNPRMRMILTVSPVPLAATAESQHVLAATTYSKSVLRVAAETTARQGEAYYFPAYEIITAGGGEYLAADRRSILEQGVQRVMALFSRHVLDGASSLAMPPDDDQSLQQSQRLVDTLCDEQRLDPSADPDPLPEDASMHTADSPDGALNRANVCRAAGHHDQAIACLTAARRKHQDARVERLLATCRFEAYHAGVPASTVADRWGGEMADPFEHVEGIPEVHASELNALVVAAGIRKHGALLVRGLFDRGTAAMLADGVKHALDACQAWHEGGQGEFVDAWYSRLGLPTECELAVARPWVEGNGGVWLADSPRMLYELTELLEQRGISRLVADYFGEPAMISVGKSTLRCVPSTIHASDWHQDGAFMGADIRSLNIWMALSPCGAEASGLEVLPHRVGRILPTGSHGASFNWSVGPDMVGQVAGAGGTLSPLFEPGDALLFDHFFVHRTGIPQAISKDRYAIESWFFAPTAYPADQVPLRL